MPYQHFLFVEELEAKPRAHFTLPPPKVEPIHDAFAEAMLEDMSTHQRRSPLDWVASIGVHLAILAMLLVLPLCFTAGLDTERLNLTFLVPAAIPAAAPPAPLIATAAPHQGRVAPARVLAPGQLLAPTFIPRAIVNASASAGAPLDEALIAAIAGIPGGQEGAVRGGVLGGGLRSVSPPAPAVAASPRTPVRVGGAVKPPRLLYAPEPEYPVLAKMSRLSGIVVIDAVIDEHGEVKGMRVVSGHPLLVPAALNAVSKRRYEPTVVNGEPTPIDLRVEISFTFS